MARMGCLVVALIAVALFVAYDQYRIEQMRNEVSAISDRLHITTGGKPDSNGSDLVTSLAEAERYTRNAKALLAKHRVRDASVQLDKALKSLKAANTVSSDIVGDAASFLGKARDNAVRVFQKTWNDISEEARPEKK